MSTDTAASRDRTNWPLAVLTLAGASITHQQLEVSVFLLGERLGKGFFADLFYDFQPGSYGATDKEVFADAEKLVESGLATKSLYSCSYYCCTPQGLRAGEKILLMAPVKEHLYAKRIVRWVSLRSFTELIAAVINEFPTYGTNLIFGRKEETRGMVA